MVNELPPLPSCLSLLVSTSLTYAKPKLPKSAVTGCLVDNSSKPCGDFNYSEEARTAVSSTMPSYRLRHAVNTQQSIVKPKLVNSKTRYMLDMCCTVWLHVCAGTASV